MNGFEWFGVVIVAIPLIATAIAYAIAPRRRGYRHYNWNPKVEATERMLDLERQMYRDELLPNLGCHASDS